MEVGIIRQINIENEMQASYLDYAMSVIVARALPDVRDGLKPVHRRILYAMHDLGLTNDKPYKKSARIVGEVLGKYHPHGDAAVYEAMVRMAQDFSLRYPLVDGQGNFGSVDGDNAAAMRYTEARLAAIADEMLADIDKDTVEWTDNFDGTLREPSVLPAALPNLLVNGSSGIAVGMATNIPPHNLGEVCDALCYLIDNYDRVENVNTEDLMHFIQGPDFPTGGVIFRYEHGGPGDDAEQVDAIERAYGGGRGSLVMQAKAHLEEMSRNRSRIVVTELPYQTDKSRLIERIAELVRDGRLEGITDLRDESDRTGMRVCIEMTRTVDPRQVLADLYKLTPLQSTFGVSLLALVDGEPRLLGLKKLLQHFIEHRREVIERRSRYELEKARQRAHILEGLLRALDLLDEIIALIRRSRTADAARLSLVREYQFSELQAQAILDMQLRRLAALERQKLQDEYKQVQKLIKELEALLNSPQKVLELIKQNLIDLKARYGDARRTQIADRVKAVLTSREHDVERDVWVALGQDGRLSVTQRTAGAVPLPLPSPAPLHLLAANTRQDVYLFTVTGRAARVLGHQLPDAPGAPVSELAGVKERIAALLALTPAESDDPASGFLLLGSALGKVKRVALADLFAQAHTSPQVIGLDSGDELAWAAAGQGQGEVLLMTAGGQSIRFAEEEVRPMGLPAGGVGGIKLRDGDRVVAGLSLAGRPAGAAANTMSAAARKREAATTIAVITAGGFGKQAALADFPPQGRFGGGVVAAKIMPKSGNIVGAALLTPGAHLVCLGASGSAQPLAAKVIPAMARATQGKTIPQLAKIAPVTRIYAVDPGDGATSPAAGPKDGQGTASSARPAAPGTNGSRTKPASDGAGAPTGERGSKGADTGPTAWSSAGELRDPLRGAEPLSPVIAAGGPAPAKTKRGVKTSGAGTASNAGPARTAKPSPEPTPEPSGRKAPASPAASAAPLTAPPSATPARLTSSRKGSAPAATAAEMATPAPPGRRGAGAKSAVKPASTTEPASASMPPTAPAGVGRRTARPAASDAQLPLVPEGDPGEGAATRRAGRTASGAGVAADNATASKTAATGASTTTGKATAGKPTATGAGTKTGKAVIGEAVKGSPASGSAAPAKGAASKAQTGKNAPAGNTGDKAAKGNAAPGSAAPAKAAAGKAQTGKDATGSKAGSKAAGGPASKDAPAAPPSPPVTLRPKRSASDGPMTWPLIPPTDEGDDEPPSLPKRGPSRPGR